MANAPTGATNYIDLINALLPLITNLAPLAAQAVSQVQAQTGKAAEQILADTGVQLDANDAKLIADLAAEHKAIQGGTK